MGLFRSYAKFKVGKAAFDKARRWWKKRQRSKSGSRVRARR
jgi:hypothetical protein